ncbi:Glycosyl transferase family 2 (fragment) [Nitrolancea hollandica Lb]|uniref:Glycosyl transferase family 2 n=1 Tax=Nitrolancea hollandica Lb TaxID=1129897 RepID=I4EG99_9BACT
METLDLNSIHSTGYAFQIELTFRAHQAGYRIVEVPIQFEERRAGQSKLSARIILEALVRVWQLRLAGRNAVTRPSPAHSDPWHPFPG